MKSDGIKELTEDLGVADKSLIEFLTDTEYSEKTLENYQLFLKNSANSMTFFQRATTTATTIGKRFIATIGSMAAAWAISEVISLAIKGILPYQTLKMVKNRAYQII